MARSIAIPPDIEHIINPLAPAVAKIAEAGNPLASAEASTVSDTGNIADFLSRLSQGNLWLRAGEFAVGMILLYVGLRTMFPEQIAAVTGPVKTAAKVGALAK
jgi:hypothetical protein